MSSCYCDYDGPEFYLRKIRRARKAHRCGECGGVIAVGERYEHVRGKWDGYIGTQKTCAMCVDLRVWVSNSIPCFCWAHGNMHDDARDAVSEAHFRAGDEVAGVRFGLARRLHAIDLHNRLSRAYRAGTSLN